MTKPKLYIIPGLAADRRLYTGYSFPDHEVEYLDWVDPLDGENLSEYSDRLASTIDESEPFILIGTSMGGIVAGCIADNKKPEKIILISSISNTDQFPLRWRVFRYFPVYWLIPFNVFRGVIKFYRKTAGRSAPGEARIFQDMLANTTSKFFKWAIHQILWHKKNKVNAPYFHIHGEKDRIFPLKYMEKDMVVVEGSDHFMVLHRRKRIQVELNKILERVV